MTGDKHPDLGPVEPWSALGQRVVNCARCNDSGFVYAAAVDPLIKGGQKIPCTCIAAGRHRRRHALGEEVIQLPPQCSTCNDTGLTADRADPVQYAPCRDCSAGKALSRQIAGLAYDMYQKKLAELEAREPPKNLSPAVHYHDCACDKCEADRLRMRTPPGKTAQNTGGSEPMYVMGPAEVAKLADDLLGNGAQISFSDVKDPWKHRSTGMRCATCMWCVEKGAGQSQVDPTKKQLGRCRRRAPTMNGYPVIYPVDDWCGDHKLDENKL